LEGRRQKYLQEKKQKPREKNHGKDTGSWREGDIREKKNK
jgi:hypothetical protein